VAVAAQGLAPGHLLHDVQKRSTIEPIGHEHR